MNLKRILFVAGALVISSNAIASNDVVSHSIGLYGGELSTNNSYKDVPFCGDYAFGSK